MLKVANTSKPVQELMSYFEESAKDPEKAVLKTMQDTGKRAVGCFPYYTPDEIVYAAGMVPIGLWGGDSETKQAGKYLQSFCCSIMRANLELGIKGGYDILAAVMIPAYCDTLKCILENWKYAVPQVRLIPIVYPQNRLPGAGVDFLISEFRHVMEELESITGKKITEDDLLESIAVYENYRKTMREFASLVEDYPVTLHAAARHHIIKASYFTDKKDYTGRLKELIRCMKQMPKESFTGIRAVLTGILAEPEPLLNLFMENNIAVVADDLAHESRQFRTSVGEGSSALEKLAIRMTKQNCSVLFDENKTRGQRLIELYKRTNADAVIVVMLKFCDPEEFDYPIYKKELIQANIPLLYLEIEQNLESAEQIRTRVQGFAEMLTETDR